jgi:tetratricopeptide (TPR) repeat protein
MKRYKTPWIEENNAAEYNRQGAGAMLRGAYREASFHLLSAVVCDPEFWPAFFNLGNVWSKLGDDEAAIWAYEQATDYCEDYAPLYLNLGILYCQNDRFRKALPYLEQSFRLAPDGVSQAIALGYAWYKLDEYGMAWHWYKKAYKLNPKNKKIRDSLVMVGEKILASG